MLMIIGKYKIPFFDLDWTLIKGGSLIHRNSIIYALKSVFNIDADIDSINIQGMVDRQILYELALKSGIKRKSILKNMEKLINNTNKIFLENSMNKKFIALPGSYELLKTLHEKKIPVGILTGNTNVIGKYKLKNTNLYDFVDYEVYGDRFLERAELVKIAIKKLKNIYPNAVFDDMIIVGDTPKDIECAKENGVKVISVATGIYKRKELYKADLVLSSLEEINKFISFITERKNVENDLLLNKSYPHPV